MGAPRVPQQKNQGFWHCRVEQLAVQELDFVRACMPLSNRQQMCEWPDLTGLSEMVADGHVPVVFPHPYLCLAELGICSNLPLLTESNLGRKGIISPYTPR